MNKILLALILAAGLQADFEPEEESAASQVAVAKSAIEKKDWDGAQTALDKAESIEAWEQTNQDLPGRVAARKERVR
jgi:hypothetical protein